jgi:hypothetical protein
LASRVIDKSMSSPHITGDQHLDKCSKIRREENHPYLVKTNTLCDSDTHCVCKRPVYCGCTSPLGGRRRLDQRVLQLMVCSKRVRSNLSSWLCRHSWSFCHHHLFHTWYLQWRRRRMVILGRSMIYYGYRF